MKILFDCRYVRFDHHDGISRFSSRLVEALAKRMPVEMLISDERQLNLLPDLPWHLIRSQTSLLEPWVAYQINKLEPDAVYSPMQTIGSWGRKFGLVLTLHDLIYHHHRTPPKFLPWYIRAGWWVYHLTWIPQRLVMNRPDEVVTISETSKRLMLKHRLTTRPITIVPNAAEPVEGERTPRPAPASRDLLYMGSFMPYKNVTTLARAMQHLPGYRLHLISKVKPDERARLEALAPAGSLVFHNGVSDAEYAALLDTSFALVHASLEEGFGIPVIEAMSHGTPAVISDTEIFREVGGEAAVFADPRDPAAFAAAVRSIEDPAEWQRRSAASLEQAKLFDWDRSADILYEVMRRVATKARPEDAKR